MTQIGNGFRFGGKRPHQRVRRTRHSIGDWNGDLTEKQFQWLKSIYLRVKPGQRW